MGEIQFYQPEYTQLRYMQRQLSYLLLELDSKDCIMDFDVFLESKNRNLQRELVWEKDGIKNHNDNYYHHRKLIESIFAYTDIGKFVVYKMRLKTAPFMTFKVIDGKQRIHAIDDFRKNKFGIFRNGVEIFFKDMPKEITNKVLHTVISYCEIDAEWKALTDDELITLFNNINFGGVPQ